MSLPGMGSKTDPHAIARVREWATTALASGEPTEYQVMVTELACTEPGCPPVETVIARLGGGETSQVTLHGAAAALNELAVVAALRAAGLVTS